MMHPLDLLLLITRVIMIATDEMRGKCGAEFGDAFLPFFLLCSLCVCWAAYGFRKTL